MAVEELFGLEVDVVGIAIYEFDWQTKLTDTYATLANHLPRIWIYGTDSSIIIHSRDDNYSNYSESAQLSKRYPSVRLEVLPAGGHLLLFYQPQQVADIIFQFIETTP